MRLEFNIKLGLVFVTLLMVAHNQTFVQIPHTQFIDMLAYKSALVGIQVVITEEAYTSKTSFLDLEPVKKHSSYLGRRLKRGLFRASDGRLIHADVNGSLNIVRKVVPAAFSQGIEDVVVHPVGLTIRPTNVNGHICTSNS